MEYAMGNTVWLVFSPKVSCKNGLGDCFQSTFSTKMTTGKGYAFLNKYNYNGFQE